MTKMIYSEGTKRSATLLINSLDIWFMLDIKTSKTVQCPWCYLVHLEGFRDLVCARNQSMRFLHYVWSFD